MNAIIQCVKMMFFSFTIIFFKMRNFTSIMCKGAKLGGATGARARVVFIPHPEIIDICASLFVFLPEVLYIGAPLLFSPVWRQCAGLI